MSLHRLACRFSKSEGSNHINVLGHCFPPALPVSMPVQGRARNQRTLHGLTAASMSPSDSA